jgi:hypothetical protein
MPALMSLSSEHAYIPFKQSMADHMSVSGSASVSLFQRYSLEVCMNEHHSSARNSTERLLVALYDSQDQAEQAVRLLVDRDFPMDMLSFLGKGQSSGDDPLGLYYSSVGDRMKGWGSMGAFWGGLWGLLAGAAGLFVIPGIGPVLAAGPVVEAIAAALAGAGLGGSAMAGAAAASEFMVAMHRSGVPVEKLEMLQDAIEQGDYLLMLRLDEEEAAKWQTLLSHSGAGMVDVYVYQGLTDLAR